MNETSLYDDIGRTLRKLLMIDPYYALFMVSLDKQETDRVPTLAVGLNGINVVLSINPKFWFGMSQEEKYGVCKHEMLHLCFMHLVNATNYQDHKRDNIATDAEINQYIDSKYLPKGCVSLEWIKSEFGVTLAEKQGRDVYYKALEGKIPESTDLGTAEHFWEQFDQLSDADKAVVQNQIDHMMTSIAEEMEKSKPGSVPGEIAAMIKAKKMPPRFDWKKYIRMWIGNSNEVEVRQTRFKPNPYFQGNPSTKIRFKKNLLIAIDTSGSVSNSELEEFMSEIHNLWKFGHTITILCVDTKIYDPYIYKGQDEIKIHGRGGTYFTPTLEYFNNHPEYSAMIYFTDGEAELPPNAIRPMLWVVSSRGTTSAIQNHNGKILKIQPENV
jgi:predicted metal-dependent peptidase